MFRVQAAPVRLRSSFARLLDTYVPLAQITRSGYAASPAFRERLKQLYDTRSQITHGSDLRGMGRSSRIHTLQSQDDDTCVLCCASCHSPLQTGYERNTTKNAPRDNRIWRPN